MKNYAKAIFDIMIRPLPKYILEGIGVYWASAISIFIVAIITEYICNQKEKK